MPELPEVETVRTGLSSSWVGKRIDGVDLRREGLRFPFPEGLEERLTGRTVKDVRRRAKYLLIDLDNGDILLSHLGMSGKWTLDASDCEGKHDHVVILFDDKSGMRAVSKMPDTTLLAVMFSRFTLMVKSVSPLMSPDSVRLICFCIR